MNRKADSCLTDDLSYGIIQLSINTKSEQKNVFEENIELLKDKLFENFPKDNINDSKTSLESEPEAALPEEKTSEQDFGNSENKNRSSKSTSIEIIKNFCFGSKTEILLTTNETTDNNINDCNIKDLISRENSVFTADVKPQDIYETTETIQLSNNSKSTDESNTEVLIENERRNLKSKALSESYSVNQDIDTTNNFNEKLVIIDDSLNSKDVILDREVENVLFDMSSKDNYVTDYFSIPISDSSEDNREEDYVMCGFESDENESSFKQLGTNDNPEFESCYTFSIMKSIPEIEEQNKTFCEMKTIQNV